MEKNQIVTHEEIAKMKRSLDVNESLWNNRVAEEVDYEINDYFKSLLEISKGLVDIVEQLLDQTEDQEKDHE